MLDEVDVAAIKKFEDTLRLKMLQLALDLQNQMRNEVIKNIGNTFGKRTKASSGYKSGRSGNLKNSVQVIQNSDFAWRLIVGSAQVPYAAIHEYGGVIVPRKAKWLTIPMHDRARGHSARELDNLTYIDDAEHTGKRAYLFDDAWELMYLLVRRVTMPKRPYVQPAIDYVTSDANMARTIAKIWRVT